MKTPVTITIDEYPGWETSISPFRMTIDGREGRPMTAEEVMANLKYPAQRFIDDFNWRNRKQ